jgi:hypothetical protein
VYNREDQTSCIAGILFGGDVEVYDGKLAPEISRENLFYGTE